MSMLLRRAMYEPVRRLVLLTGAGRRRTWLQDEKATIDAESEVSATSISAVARRHGLSVSQLFTWRRLAGQEPAPVKAKAEPH
jgi:transposase